MNRICELNDQVILGKDGRSTRAPRITARAIIKRTDGRYAVMYSDKYRLYSLPGGGVEDGEDLLTALKREVLEETGCLCDQIDELGYVTENRGSLDYTQINYYFVVLTGSTGVNPCFTDAERDNRTEVQWHTFDKMVSLITDQKFERVQGKYLRARDVAALQEFCER